MPTATATSPKTRFRMAVDKLCKGSNRFATSDPDAVVKTIYVEKSSPAAYAPVIEVEVADATTDGAGGGTLLTRGKDCVHSVRYELPAGQEESGEPLTNVYLSRAFANPMPAAVRVKLTPVGAPAAA